MRLVVLVGLLLCARSAAAGHELSDEVTLMLGDRIAIQLPEGMKKVANQRDFYNLALPEPVAHRAELTLANGALFVVVRQTFAHVEGDFRRAVNAELALHDLVGITRAVTLKNGNEAVTVDPPAPRRGDENDLIHAIYIRGDSTRVYSISFYVSGGAFDDIATWVQLAQRSTATARIDYRGYYHYYSTPMSVPIGRVTAELALPVDWDVVPIRSDGANAVIGYQHATLGAPAAVCGIDQGRPETASNVRTAQLKVLGAVETARSWKVGNRGQAEVTSSHGGRVWCRVRGGKPDDALAALRTFIAAVALPATTSPGTGR